MIKLILFSIIFVYLTLPSVAQAMDQEIFIGGTPYDIGKYKKWVGDKQCTDINSFQHKFAYRVTIEMLLICKALHLGGLKPTITFVHLPNYVRSVHETKQGNIAMHSESVWNTSTDDQTLYLSDPIIEANYYTKGFYTTTDKHPHIQKLVNNAATKAEALNIIQQFSVISSQVWVEDWAILNKLNIPIMHSPEIDRTCIMLKKGRADLYFGEFMMNGQHRLDTICKKVKLVEGIKLSLPKSRHFVVSKDFPNGKQIFIALQKGIKILKHSGELKKALYPNSPYNKAIQQWIELAPK